MILHNKSITEMREQKGNQFDCLKALLCLPPSSFCHFQAQEGLTATDLHFSLLLIWKQRSINPSHSLEQSLLSISLHLLCPVAEYILFAFLYWWSGDNCVLGLVGGSTHADTQCAACSLYMVSLVTKLTFAHTTCSWAYQYIITKKDN